MIILIPLERAVLIYSHLLGDLRQGEVVVVVQIHDVPTALGEDIAVEIQQVADLQILLKHRNAPAWDGVKQIALQIIPQAGAFVKSFRKVF